MCHTQKYTPQNVPYSENKFQKMCHTQKYTSENVPSVKLASQNLKAKTKSIGNTDNLIHVHIIKFLQQCINESKC